MYISWFPSNGASAALAEAGFDLLAPPSRYRESAREMERLQNRKMERGSVEAAREEEPQKLGESRS